MKTREFERFNDGVISIYRKKPKSTSFNAEENASALSDLDFVARLDFAEVSRREQDLEFAERNDFALDLKVKTRAVPGVDNRCKAIIGHTLYDIHLCDKTRTVMWLYMQEVKSLDP